MGWVVIHVYGLLIYSLFGVRCIILQKTKQQKQFIGDRLVPLLLREVMKLPNLGSKQYLMVAPGFRHQALENAWIRVLLCPPSGLSTKGLTRKELLLFENAESTDLVE